MERCYTRQVDDKEFIPLAILHYEYMNSLDRGYFPMWKSTEELLKALKKPEAMALGLFIQDNLVGFVLGNKDKNRNDAYYFSALYISPRYRLYIKRLYNAAEEMVTGRYKYWITDAINEVASNLHKRMGASVLEKQEDRIVYIKEI